MTIPFPRGCFVVRLSHEGGRRRRRGRPRALRHRRRGGTPERARQLPDALEEHLLHVRQQLRLSALRHQQRSPPAAAEARELRVRLGRLGEHAPRRPIARGLRERQRLQLDGARAAVRDDVEARRLHVHVPGSRLDVPQRERPRLVPQPPALAPVLSGVRLREHGLRIGSFEAGPANSIADVDGVTVGHVTVWRDEAEPPDGRGVARTGVTAVVPPSAPLSAGAAVLNGAGELTSFIEIQEWGLIDTPVYLTSTMAVGRIYDGAVSVALAGDPRVGVDDVVIPTVGECDDSWLSESRIVQVQPA